MAGIVYKLIKITRTDTGEPIDGIYYEVDREKIGQYVLMDRDYMRIGSGFSPWTPEGYPLGLRPDGDIRNVFAIRQGGRDFLSVITGSLHYRFYDTGLTLQEYMRRKEDK